MKTLPTLLLCLFLFAASAIAADPRPYIGDWSNGRGETLRITARTIQFADDDPVPYREISHEAESAEFELQITAKGEVNAFPGKTLALVIEEDAMEMTGYRSHEDLAHNGETLQVVTWYRETNDEEED
ncbi:MAG: hypothetical protein M3032_01910 [Verrucomicrobiota bacterium]|nr:hypothetical protein [Verrucomicrobiota bacterium]